MNDTDIWLAVRETVSRCKYCGGRPVLMSFPGTSYLVLCIECDKHGGDGKTIEAAAQKWNEQNVLS